MKRVVKNSFFQTFGAFGITGLNFLLILGYGRLLGPAGLGSLVTSQAQVLVWTFLVDLGLSNSLIGALTSAEGGRTELSRQGFRARDLLFRVLFLRLLGALIGGAGIYLLAVWHHGPGTPAFWQDMAFSPYLFALALQSTALSFAAYRHRQGLSVLANLGGVLFTVVLALWLARKGAEVRWLLLAQSWGGFATAAVLFGYFFVVSSGRKRAGTTRRLERTRRGPWGAEAWAALASDAWPYAITFAVLVLWQRLDQLAASHFLGLEQGGQYALAVRLVAIPVLVATSISFALFPDLQRLGRDAPERMQVMLGAMSKAIWRYGVFAAALIVLVLSYLFVPLVPKFKPALALLPYFVPGIWAFWMQSFVVNALFGMRRYRAVVGAHLWSLAVYVPALFVLTRAYGLHGVVWSYNIFCFGMCIFGFRAAKRAGLFPHGFALYRSYSAAENELWAQSRLFRGKK